MTEIKQCGFGAAFDDAEEWGETARCCGGAFACLRDCISRWTYLIDSLDYLEP